MALAKSKTLHLVNCARYNNSRDVLFCMRADDSRLGDGNYESLGVLSKVDRATFELDGVRYHRFSDWSMRKISE